LIFNSTEFFIFLPIVLVLYYWASFKWQNILLLTASYIFYGFWDWRFLFLLGISTITDFFCGKYIHQSSTDRSRKLFLLISLFVNLSILAFFKYFNFFADSLYQTLKQFGFTTNNTLAIDILLPVGISFYTFQTMAYTIDIYRRKSAPTKSFTNFSLYVAYFPQLVAGPIERAQKLLPQLENPRNINPAIVASGISLIITGLFKKVVIGDFFAAPYADLAFSESSSTSPQLLMLGLCMFSLQIYTDFSGYTDIARGVSRMLGIQLMVNFRQPYLSRNITEFWKRWHISLSEWLRDYLYIPLGGNRNGQWNTCRNLMITMLLGGLWHGANWTFIVWGGLHGLYLIIHKIIVGQTKLNFSNISNFKNLKSNLWKIALTNILVLLTWIFFRASDLNHGFDYVMTLIIGISSPIILLKVFSIFVFYLIIVFMIDLPLYKNDSDEILSSTHPYIRISVYALFILAIWITWPTNYTPFIYFQF
jgi:D-alanyl-lipoteichoic acid acyltransferase DltB (MBOAT superfamily)